MSQENFKSLDLIDLENKARNLADQGKLNESKEVYLELLSRVPNWEHGLGDYELGLVYEELGEYEDALKSYKTAIERQRRPHDQMFWQALVMLLFKLDDLEPCFDAICSVIQMYPTDYDDVFYKYLCKYGAVKGLTKLEIESKVCKRVPGFKFEDRQLSQWLL